MGTASTRQPASLVCFVSGLPKTCSEADLQTAFAPYGVVASVRCVRDECADCRGYAFVEFQDVGAEEACAAVQEVLGCCVGVHLRQQAASPWSAALYPQVAEAGPDASVTQLLLLLRSQADRKSAVCAALEHMQRTRKNELADSPDLPKQANEPAIMQPQSLPLAPAAPAHSDATKQAPASPLAEAGAVDPAAAPVPTPYATAAPEPVNSQPAGSPAVAADTGLSVQVVPANTDSKTQAPNTPENGAALEPGSADDVALDDYPSCKRLVGKLQASSSHNSKTPLAILHDHATRSHLEVKYLESSDVPQDMFGITARLSEGDGSTLVAMATGKGRSKQMAKQAAAAELLEVLLGQVPETHFLQLPKPKGREQRPPDMRGRRGLGRAIRHQPGRGGRDFPGATEPTRGRGRTGPQPMRGQGRRASAGRSSLGRHAGVARGRSGPPPHASGIPQNRQPATRQPPAAQKRSYQSMNSLEPMRPLPPILPHSVYLPSSQASFQAAGQRRMLTSGTWNTEQPQQSQMLSNRLQRPQHQEVDLVDRFESHPPQVHPLQHHVAPDSILRQQPEFQQQPQHHMQVGGQFQAHLPQLRPLQAQPPLQHQGGQQQPSNFEQPLPQPVMQYQSPHEQPLHYHQPQEQPQPMQQPQRAWAGGPGYL